MAQAKKTKQTKNNGANVGYEAELWQMADALRGSMDAAEYKHVVLGLIFLKYISDSFEEQHAKLEAERAQSADPEDQDEYRALSIFWVPPEARWSHLKAQAKQPTIGQLVDDAMSGIERDNASLKSVRPKDYARSALDKQRLGQLIDLISNIDFRQPSPEPSRRERVRVRVKVLHTPISLASARALRSTTFASTATSSHRVAMSARRPLKTTASRSAKKCSGLLPNCASSRPRPQSWMLPSPPT